MSNKNNKPKSNMTLIKLKAMFDIIIAFSLIYILFNFSINSPLISFTILIFAIYFIAQCLGNVDKINGFGQYNKNKYQEQDDSIIEEYSPPNTDIIDENELDDNTYEDINTDDNQTNNDDFNDFPDDDDDFPFNNPNDNYISKNYYF